LKEKSREKQEQVELYRGYLEKAKIVIKYLDPTKVAGNNSELDYLRSQLNDKERIIKQLTVCVLLNLTFFLKS
jgi:hypothetical protein